VAKRILSVWRTAEGEQKVVRTQIVVKMNIWEKMGLELGHDTLRVARVAPGGQAEKKHVEAGWICKKVDKVPVVKKEIKKEII
jgi:C-terminal processing protease CtpA/Prc